jgi:hypothetical protein
MMRVPMIILTIVLAAVTVFLVGVQSAAKKQTAASLSLLSSVPKDFDADAERKARDAFAAEINGALRAQGYFYKSAAAEKDKRIYYAEKVSGLEKRLRKKAEELNIRYPEVYLPKNLPSEQDADVFIKQLESAEAIVDAGLSVGVRFKELRVSGERKGDKKAEALSISASFETVGNAMASFLYEVVRREPLLTISALKIVRTKKGLAGDLTVDEFNYGKELFAAFVPKEERAADLRERFRVSEKQKDDLFAATFLTVPEEIAAVMQEDIDDEPVEAAEKKTLLYKGVAKKKGQPCAVIEDTVKDSIAFLLPGEKSGSVKLVSFTEDEAVIDDVAKGTQETLKREIE